MARLLKDREQKLRSIIRNNCYATHSGMVFFMRRIQTEMQKKFGKGYTIGRPKNPHNLPNTLVVSLWGRNRYVATVLDTNTVTVQPSAA